jgi:hypothetical protein
MPERGVIRNRAFRQQINDFSGLRFGKITPTDLDAFMDFHNKLFVFVEAKHHGAEMPYGQRLALERVCDACHNPPHRYAVAFLTRHDCEGDIDFASTAVTRYRWNGKWISPKNVGGTLVQGINAFRELCLSSNIIPFKGKA